MIETMLTTVDNPYSPFDEWDDWFAFDTLRGYHTLGFLDRIAKTSIELSDPDNNVAIDAAIDEIVRENVLGVYKKVSRETKDEKDTSET